MIVNYVSPYLTRPVRTLEQARADRDRLRSRQHHEPRKPVRGERPCC